VKPICSKRCAVSRVPTNDERMGMVWWNGMSEAERRHWLDIAWRRNEKAAGRIGYSLDDMPSVADAWATYKQRPRIRGPD
jgi:hypothetical protein